MTDRFRDDDAGFAAFVAAHETRLRQALTAVLGPVRGREAAVEALSFGWEHWERVSRMDNPVGYLFVVGRERSTRFERRRPDRPTDRLEPPTADASHWYEPALPGLIEELSERQRHVVLLVHGAGWSLGEVAELLDVSKSSVQTYADRGLEKLRAGLGVRS